MFQFTTFPFLKLCIYLRMTELFSAGFPHSDICGSIVICTSPQLFAAYHVLHRLLVPRHSPCALSCLTFFTSLTSNVVAILHFFAVSSAWLKINLNCIYACSIFIFQAYRALALTATSSDVKVETANQNLLLLDVFLFIWLLLYMFSFQGAYVSYLCNRQWRLRDSNSRPPACKAGALPTELNPHGTLFVLCS